MNPALLTPVETVRRIFETNFLGTFLFCREAAKLMRNQEAGRIVNFASGAVPLKLAGEAIYASSKAAVVSFTQILARELASYNTTVNAIGPGPLRTDLLSGIPEQTIQDVVGRQAIRRMADFPDVTNVVDFFLKPESSFITGQVIYLGGIEMCGEFLQPIFRANLDKAAIVWKDTAFSYGWLLDHTSFWHRRLKECGVRSGMVAAICADFSPNSVALFLALLQQASVLVPVAQPPPLDIATLLRIAEVEVTLSLSSEDEVQVTHTLSEASHPLYQELRRRGRPGLVLFSSGSAGAAKAVVHDLEGILRKFETPRRPWRAIPFLLFDHIGGVNTILHVLSNAGCLVTVTERTPDAVLQAVSRHRVELLPTSPTFINLILLSEAYRRHDLSSLQVVTYGTEPMPESTLQRFHNLFPHVQLSQTYGLSEVGILRSKSRCSDSLWFKIGGEGFKTRVINGMLEIKAESAMLGYLNAPSPFTPDGWLQTGDVVEVDGEYIKILGRNSEIINVGGRRFSRQRWRTLLENWRASPK